MPALLAVFGAPGWVELLIVGLIVLVLFGTRLPSVMRSLGVGITEFRKGIKGEVDADGNAVIENAEEDNGQSKDKVSHSTSSTTV